MKRFAALILGLLIPTLLIGFTLRMKGLAERHQALPHPMNDKDFYYIAYQAGSKEAPANTWEAIDEVRKQSWQIVLWLDVHQTRDGQLVLFGEDYLETQTEGQGHIGFHTWEQVRALDAGYRFKSGDGFPYRGKGLKIRTLEDTLKQYPDSEFVLNIKANSAKIDLEVTALIEKLQAGNRVILTSPYEFVLKSLRSQKPLWMFGIGLAQLTRLAMFAAVHLEPVIPITGDILITPPTAHTRLLDETVIREIQRRKKKVIPWVAETKQWDMYREMKVDGILTDAPSKFIFLVNPTLAPAEREN